MEAGVQLTDQEKAAAAWAELAQTTISYNKWKQQGFTEGHWANASRLLGQIGTTPAPPPPNTSTTKGGIGLQALGGGVPSGVGRFDVFTADESNVPTALAQTPKAGRTFVYMAACDVSAYTPHYGVSLADAAANNWELLDAAGKVLVNLSYPSNVIGDVGNPGFQARWLSNVIATAKRLGVQGVYIDDVLADTQLLIGASQGLYPAKYPSQAAWQNAMVSFMAYVGPGLKAAGLYVYVNAGAFTPGSAGSNDATDTTAWWKRIGPHVNGLQLEYWQQNPNAVDTVMTSDASKSWLGQWQSWQTLPAVARSVGADFYALTYGGAAAQTYVRASFLLGWDGKSGAQIGAAGNSPVNLATLGQPTGAATQSGGVWTRPFQYGRVTVDSFRGTATIG